MADYSWCLGDDKNYKYWQYHFGENLFIFIAVYHGAFCKIGPDEAALLLVLLICWLWLKEQVHNNAQYYGFV